MGVLWWPWDGVDGRMRPRWMGRQEISSGAGHRWVMDFLATVEEGSGDGDGWAGADEWDTRLWLGYALCVGYPPGIGGSGSRGARRSRHRGVTARDGALAFGWGGVEATRFGSAEGYLGHRRRLNASFGGVDCAGRSAKGRS